MDSRLSSGRMRHPNGAHVVGIVDTLASSAYIVAVRSQGYRLLSQGASLLVRWNQALQNLGKRCIAWVIGLTRFPNCMSGGMFCVTSKSSVLVAPDSEVSTLPLVDSLRARCRSGLPRDGSNERSEKFVLGKADS
jgi:hypothetical protein